MLGHWPIGTRPLGTLRRKTTGPVSAILAIAGTATAFYSAVAPASSTVTFAGNGSTNFVNNAGQGVLAATGAGTLSVAAISKGSMSLLAAGLGAASPKLAASARSSLAANGSAAFTPVMTAKISASVTIHGFGDLLGSNLPGYVANFSGTGYFAAVGYALYLDAEKAGPAYEQRIAYVSGEARAAVAPSEDRVYYVSSKSASPGPPNRRRVL